MGPKLLKYSRTTLHIARAVNAIANEHCPVSSDRNSTDPESPSAVHKYRSFCVLGVPGPQVPGTIPISITRQLQIMMRTARRVRERLAS